MTLVTKITEVQAHVLRYLDSQDATIGKRECWPAEIGNAIQLAQGKRELRAQGAGRLGGTVATRLVEKGLVWRSGRGYVISTKGQQALWDWDHGHVRG